MSNVSQVENEPVTVVWNWTIGHGKEEMFEHMMHDIHNVARTFPGHMGVTTLQSPEKKDNFQTILRFDNVSHLERWLNSDIRQKMLEPLSEIAHENAATKATGLETWFEVPGKTVTPPPRWKMVVTTFIAIYPLSVVYGFLVAPNTLSWPTLVRALILPIFAPIILTYAFMPFLTQKVLRPWLYRAS